MKLLPAVDIRGGRTVQLVGGVPGTEKVSLPNPVATAEELLGRGFDQLHVVDLDAALGQGSNLDLITELIAAFDVPVQVGGGVRDDEAAARLFGAGAARVIVGTRAVQDHAWVENLAQQWPNRIVVACDVKGVQVVTRGWTETTALTAHDFLNRMTALPLASVLVTDVSREGQLAGINGSLFEDLVNATVHPLQAAGGVTTVNDISTLNRAGVAAAVLGMSLYTGTIDVAQAFKAAARSATQPEASPENDRETP